MRGGGGGGGGGEGGGDSEDWRRVGRRKSKRNMGFQRGDNKNTYTSRKLHRRIFTTKRKYTNICFLILFFFAKLPPIVFKLLWAIVWKIRILKSYKWYMLIQELFLKLALRLWHFLSKRTVHICGFLDASSTPRISIWGFVRPSVCGYVRYPFPKITRIHLKSPTNHSLTLLDVSLHPRDLIYVV